MTRRDILKALVAFAACVRAYAKTPQGAGLVVVRIAERHSDICLMRDGVEISRERIPIGRAHFVNDVAWCLWIEREDAAELVEQCGIPPREARQGTLALNCRRRATGDTKTSTLSVSRKLYAEIIEARAVEFAELIRNTLKRAGVVDTPILLAGDGAGIHGLSAVV